MARESKHRTRPDTFIESLNVVGFVKHDEDSEASAKADEITKIIRGHLISANENLGVRGG